MLELRSNAFHKRYRLFAPGRVPTSNKIHTLGLTGVSESFEYHCDIMTYLQKRGEGVKKPAMTINLLLVLLFQTEYDLRWNRALVGILKVQIWIQCERCSIFKQMRSNWHRLILAIYTSLQGRFHDSILIYPQ
jgi:hypothetical protein